MVLLSGTCSACDGVLPICRSAGLCGHLRISLFGTPVKKLNILAVRVSWSLEQKVETLMIGISGRTPIALIYTRL